MTILAAERRSVDTVYLATSKEYDTVSHNILVNKLMRYSLGKWEVRCTENWLTCQAQTNVISDMKSSGSQSVVVYPKS